MFVMYFIH